MVDALRTSLLVYQLQTRIKDTAFIQRRIYEDVDLFKDGGIEARARFEQSRQTYLEVLGMSVGQLREAMDSEGDNPIYDEEVEEIMKRVKPLSKDLLQRLVIEGHITNMDMKYILAGEYSSVQEFFEDVERTASSISLNSEASSFNGVPNSRSDDNLPSKYDESGFLLGDGHDEEIHPEKPATDSLQAESHSPDSCTVSTVVLQPRRESFSWADDVEDELEAIGSHGKSTGEVPSTPSLPPLEHSSLDAPMRLSNSDDIDMDADHQESSISSPEPHFYTQPQKGEQVDIEMVENLVDAQSSSIFDAADVIRESKPSIIQACLKAGIPIDSDEILDVWIGDYEMWFWQYEVVFAAKLTARKFKDEFQSARDAYKVDPFADLDR